ncbi:MAG: AAA family ATPase [Spirochaetaceae bacterium]|jgi:flagellar biosynthesis protein FlhG|nr:AAA family ATPase [Spirochaetaceae bacterium]
MRIIPIASGKGGVGKTLVSANLAVLFARAGKRTVLVDLDLGASNAHIMLGHTSGGKGVCDFLNDPKLAFSKIIAPSDIDNLRFIPGDGEIPGAASIKPKERNRLVSELRGLASSTDILLLDLGAGTHQSILDFFLMSGQGIIVSSPALTATLNAYLFLKNTVFRMMYSVFPKNSEAVKYLESLRKESTGPNSAKKSLYVPQILQQIKRKDPKSYEKFEKIAAQFHPRLIMNMIENPKDAEAATKIRRSCTEYLDIGLEYLGVVYRDMLQDTALASRLPITIYKPQSLLSQALGRIANKVLAEPEEEFMLDEEELDISFMEAAAAAESDFENKSDYVAELLHSGVLSEGELLETVKTQQLEINKLRTENNFLKYKLVQMAQ